MTPQEQPDSQAADIEKSLRHGVNGGILDVHRISMSGDSQAGDDPTLDELLDLLQSRRSPLLDFNKQRIRDYAERLATKRVHQYADLLKEGSKQTGSVNIDEGLQVFTATLTKEEQNDTN